MEPMLIFTHIPKSGGNTVNAIFRGICHHRGWNALTLSGSTSFYGRVLAPLELMVKTNIQRRCFEFITGHVPFVTSMTCFGPAQFVTVLRDPVARFLSDYCSQPDNIVQRDFGLSKIDHWLNTDLRPEFCHDNLQVRMLADAPRFSERATPAMLDEAIRNLKAFYLFTGILENIDGFINDVAEMCGVRIGIIPHLNKSNPYQHAITTDIADAVLRENELDMQLYEQVNAQIQERSSNGKQGSTQNNTERPEIVPISFPSSLPMLPARNVNRNSNQEIILGPGEFIAI